MIVINHDMIVIMLSNEKPNPIVTELFIKGRWLNIFLAFITQSYFAVPQNVRLSSTHYFLMEIPSNWVLQQIAFNHLSDIALKTLQIFIKSV